MTTATKNSCNACMNLCFGASGKELMHFRSSINTLVSSLSFFKPHYSSAVAVQTSALTGPGVWDGKTTMPFQIPAAWWRGRVVDRKKRTFTPRSAGKSHFKVHSRLTLCTWSDDMSWCAPPQGCIIAIKRFLFYNLVWVGAVCITLGVTEVNCLSIMFSRAFTMMWICVC